MAKHWSRLDISTLMFVSMKITVYIVDIVIIPGTYTLVHIIDQGRGPKEEFSTTYET